VISIVQDNDYVEKIKLLLSSGLEYLIERVSVKFEVVDRAYVVRKQFPLSLSYGITIHKSQGLSLQNAIMDIGISVFSCGQTYVALSRVTSLEGLHLINFDPLSVIASEDAIIEYNRLKKIHKPKTKMIAMSKEHYYKVKDVLWALPKVVASVQKSSLDQNVRQNTAWVMHGFQNTDKVSCYANAVLQCLLNLNAIRQQLSNYDKSDVLRVLMHRYENEICNLNTYAIRQCLGDYFSSPVKRNASDFFMALCEKYDCIKSLVRHQITTIKRCKTCNNTKTIVDNNIIISIPINNLKKKSYNLNDLLKTTFSHWYQLHNESCEYCTESNIILKNEIILTKEIVVIRLIFSSQDDKLMKTTYNFNLSVVPTTSVYRWTVV